MDWILVWAMNISRFGTPYYVITGVSYEDCQHTLVKRLEVTHSEYITIYNPIERTYFLSIVVDRTSAPVRLARGSKPE